MRKLFTVMALLCLTPTAAWAAAHGEWGAAQKLDEIGGNSSEVNTASLDGCPIQSPDGRSLYMASNRPGGKGGLDIWVARRDGRSGPWGAPVNLPEPINSAADDFCPTPLTHDRLLFVSRRVTGESCGKGDIYLTRWSRGRGWTEPQMLPCAPSGPNSALDEQGPSLLERGGDDDDDDRGRSSWLYFSRSDLPPNPPNGDIFVSRDFGPASPVSELNTPGNDIQPNVRADGREIVWSSTAAGNADIWSATRSSIRRPWSAPVRLGDAINTSAAETRPSLSRDGRQLLFGRSPGPEGSSDIFVSTRARTSHDDEDDD